MIQRELVPGKLRIVRRIGAGGMGVVYEAIHLGLARRVAVKVIHPQSSESVEARTRFFREARAMALLQSEHIVQVLDVDTLPEGDPYMVMEYLEGRDLKRELAKRGPLPVAEAVGYLIQASTGVAAAHGAGIIHRDIKPANIFITNLDGARRAKILDFGVAKFSASPDQQLTGPTCLLGTPLYMSPEQIAGMDADTRCDVWALGVVLFQLLTGHSPFRAKNNEGMIGAVLNGSAASLHETRADVPLALSQVVARCLEKVHAERFEDARELVAALAPFGPREPIVRPSRRVPRGSSAPAAPLDSELEQIVIVPRAPALPSPGELITITHPARAEHIPAVTLVRASIPIASGALGSSPDPAQPRADSDATIRFRSPDPLRTQAASRPVLASQPLVSSSTDSGSSRSARAKRLVIPIAGLVLLGLGLVLAIGVRAVPAETPADAAPRSGANAVSPPPIAPSGELASATLSGPAAALAAPAASTTEAASLAPRHSRPALPENSARASLPVTAAKLRKLPPPALPAAPAGSAAVPLHL